MRGAGCDKEVKKLDEFYNSAKSKFMAFMEDGVLEKHIL